MILLCEIIGYGFNDIHINNILQLFKSKTIIVTHFSSWIKAQNSGKTPNYWDDEILNILTNKVAPQGDGFGDGDELGKLDWIVSKNEQVRIWWQGIGRDFYYNWYRIIS